MLPIRGRAAAESAGLFDEDARLRLFLVATVSGSVSGGTMKPKSKKNHGPDVWACAMRPPTDRPTLLRRRVQRCRFRAAAVKVSSGVFFRATAKWAPDARLRLVQRRRSGPVPTGRRASRPPSASCSTPATRCSSGGATELINLYNDAYMPDPRRASTPTRSGGPPPRSGRRSGTPSARGRGRALRRGGRPGRGAAARHGAERLPRGDVLHLLLQPGPRRRRAASAASSAPAPRTPQRVIGERRLRTLRELAARTPARARPPRTPARPLRGTLAENPHDLPFALHLPARRRRTTARAGRVRPASPEARPQPARPSTWRRTAQRAVAVRARSRARAGRAGRRPAAAVRAAARRRLAGAAAARPSSCRSAARARTGAAGVPGRRASARAGCSTTTTGASSTWSRAQIATADRQRAGLRGGAAARRGAGRARPGQDRVLLATSATSSAPR